MPLSPLASDIPAPLRRQKLEALLQFIVAKNALPRGSGPVVRTPGAAPSARPQLAAVPQTTVPQTTVPQTTVPQTTVPQPVPPTVVAAAAPAAVKQAVSQVFANAPVLTGGRQARLEALLAQVVSFRAKHRR